jgi:signal transduction histidine kinase/ligand-binding sensor domain-containing protein
MRARFVILMWLMSSLSAPAQNFAPSDLLSQSSYFQWTGENGLVSNNVTSSLQARSGFIWITTYNGLMRFDGTHVEVFDRSSIPFLATDAFYRVYEDSKGVLWFASQGSGLIKYEDREFKQVIPNNDTLPKSIRCLLLEKDNVIWIGSNTEGLFKLTNNKLEKISHPILDHIGILDMHRDFNNHLWIATDGQGVFRWDGTAFQSYTTEEGLVSNVVNALEVTPDGTVYIGTANGMNMFRAGKIVTNRFLAVTPINAIIMDRDNRLWIGSENGLGRIFPDGKREEFVGEETGAPFVRINGISFDNEGSTWLSTGRHGLIQLKQTGVLNLTTVEGLAINRINIAVEGANRAFYIGTDNGKVNIYQEGKITTLPIRTDLGGAGIRDICLDKNGVIWIASYKGILRIEGTSERLFTTADGLPADDMRRILLDSQGRLWFASRSGGIAQFKNNRVVRVIDKDNGLRSNYILAMEEGADGKIYIGTHSGGLSVIENDGTITNHALTSDDAGVLAFNLYPDPVGNVWIVCNTGPYFFNGKTFKEIELSASIKGETYFDWLEDAYGTIWMTTNIGVLRFTKEDVRKFLSGELQRVPTKLFDNQDGMKNKECTGATRSLLSSDGKIWVPTIGGVSVFYPDKIRENTIVPPVYITDIITDDATFTKTNSTSVTIPQGNLRTTIHFTALSYLSPSKTAFRYKLDPVDKDWVSVHNVREAEYTNLPPGRYTFLVIAANNDGLWNTQGDSIEIVVLPFFYQTVWFYVLLALGILISLYGLYKWRVSRIEKRNAELRKLNEELDRFVYSTSHDLRAPLASIMGLVNLSRLEKDNKDHYIDLIEKSVGKLDQFIGEITDYSRNARLDVDPREIHFEKLLNTLLDDLKYLDEKASITKSVEITGAGTFYTDELRLKILLNNLISNALKYHNPHQEHPFVKIHITYNSDEAQIKVIDNGIGIDEKHLPNIFKMFYRGSDKSRGSGLGLYIVKETIDKLRGSVDVLSYHGEGSTFTVKLPSIKPKE